MDNLTPEELERFEANDTITKEELRGLRQRAEADPSTWMVLPGSARYSGVIEPVSLGFIHKPTQKSYSFGFAKINNMWFKAPQQP